MTTSARPKCHALPFSAGPWISPLLWLVGTGCWWVVAFCLRSWWGPLASWQSFTLLGMGIVLGGITCFQWNAALHEVLKEGLARYHAKRH